MKKIVVLFLLLWISNVNASTVKEVIFDRCVDGDTAYFFVDNESTKFRFLALDTPESVHPKKKEEAYGKKASEYTCEVLTNAKSIVVEYDEGSDSTDKYDRDLAWIWVDNELLQKKLIENGLGQVAYIYGDYKYTKNLCAIQKKAIEQSLNVWSDASYKEGYCANVDVTGVSTEIAMDVKSEETKKENEYIVYIVLAGCVIISVVTGKKINVKRLKKALK